MQAAKQLKSPFSSAAPEFLWNQKLFSPLGIDSDFIRGDLGVDHVKHHHYRIADIVTGWRVAKLGPQCQLGLRAFRWIGTGVGYPCYIVGNGQNLTLKCSLHERVRTAP